MAADGVARVADDADLVAGHDAVALFEQGGLGEVHVGVVDAGARTVDDDVVAGVALVARVLHGAAAGGDERGSAGGEDVLALVDVARAPGAEAARRAPVAVASADREAVVEEQERARRDGVAGRAGGLRALRRGVDAELVAATGARLPGRGVHAV